MRRSVASGLNARAAPPPWLEQAERGHYGSIRAYTWLARKLGRRVARLFLPPTALYFLLFSVRARAASRQYLRRVLGREPRLVDLYRHYHAFAAVTLDRVYLIAGEYGRFEIRTFDEDIVRKVVAEGKGGFLLGAHFGSFEVIRSLGREVNAPTVRMVMYQENARKLLGALEKINPDLAQNVIGLGTVDSMLKIERALNDGEFVGMLADRTFAGEGEITVSFLGAPARLPAGPLRMAAIMKRKVVLMIGLYRGGKRYDIHFEKLADLSAVPRGARDAAIEDAMRLYAQRLEHYCRLAPYNWFNFYDYWA